MNGQFTAMAMLLGASLLWWILPLLWRFHQESSLKRLCRKHCLLVLSFDDGPSDRLTPLLIDLLHRHDVPATFFLLGREARQRPDTVSLLASNGHELGSHTAEHHNDWKSLPWRSARDRRNGAEIVDALGGNGSLFRPPYGKLTLYGLINGHLSGTRFAFWTLDTRDSWKPRPITEVIAELVEARGGVVLLHDFDRHPAGASKASSAEYVLTLTEQLIQTAKSEGLTLVRFGDLQRWKTT